MGDDISRRGLKPTACGGGETSIRNLVPYVRRCRLEDDTKEGSQKPDGRMWTEIVWIRVRIKDHYKDFQNTIEKNIPCKKERWRLS